MFSRLKETVGAWRAALVFVVVVLLWGSTFIAVKYCLRDWSPVQVVAGRYMLGALILVPWAVRALRLHAKLYRGARFALVHLAVVGSLIPVGLMTWAQQSLPSSAAGIIASLSPMMTLLVGVLIWAQPTRPLHWLGIISGMCGVAVLRIGADTQPTALTHLSIGAIGAALLATLCWGLAAQHYRRHLAHADAVLTTALSFQVMACIMGLGLMAQTVLDRGAMSFDHKSVNAWLHLLMLGALSALAVSGYNWLIAQWGALRASACTYVVPVVAVIWGAMDDEPMGWHVPIAVMLIGLAMWAVKRPVVTKQ